MKQILFILFTSLAFSSLIAQEKTSTAPNQNIRIPEYKVHAVPKYGDPQVINRNRKNTSRTTSLSYYSWFDYYTSNYVAPGHRQFAFNVYPDSNLYDPTIVTSTCDGYISCHGMGMSFDPTDYGYYTPAGVTVGTLDNTMNYTIDTISILDKYIMNNTSLGGLSDSIVIDIIASASVGAGEYLRIYNPPFGGAYTSLATDGIPHSFVTDYMPVNWIIAPQFANDCWDSVSTLQMRRYAIAVNAATAADTNAAGYHVTTIPLSSFVVPAGQKVEVYVHFKSAVNYPLGTLITTANYYQIFAGDPTGNFPVQSAGSYQCGLISQHQNDYGLATYAGHNTLYSPLDLYNPAAPPSTPFGFEVPRFSFYISWNSASTYSILTHNISTPATACIGADFYIEVTGASSLLRVKTYFGDGTTDSSGLIASASTSSATIAHSYSSPGLYTVKQVLYYNNVPEDSVTFSNEYLSCSTLPIMLYNDFNGDCIKDSTEPFNSIPTLVRVDSNGITVDTITVTSGLYYNTFGPPGTIYSFSIISATYAPSCSSATVLYDTIVAIGHIYPVQYYGLSCSGSGVFDLELTTCLLPGPHAAHGTIMLNNNYCTPENATITMNFSPKYIFGSSSPSPTSIVGNTITWDFSSVSLITGVDNIYFHLAIPGAYLTPGDTVNANFSVTPVTGDINPVNNYYAIVDTITASYDPNEMSVSPSGCILIDTVTQLQYTISFMNIGNDTAFNTAVMDTLSDNVDPKSLRIVMASNTMNIALLNNGTHNIVKFDFPAINLLDSAACPLCSGAVIFTVNTRPGLPSGTTILNRAGVFFDDNPVVMTNTVEDIMGGCFPASVNNSTQQGTGNVIIFPSPATNQLTITMSQNAYSSFIITNSIGQQLLQQSLTLTQTNVNISSLSPGLYYITFKGDNGTSVKKFVKL